MKRQFNDKCPKKKQITLGGIKAIADKAPGDTTTDTATATITTNNISETEHSQEIESLYDDVSEDHKETGFAQNMADLKTGHNFSEMMLKTRMHYWSSSDPKAMESDKTCIICNKQKNDLDSLCKTS